VRLSTRSSSATSGNRQERAVLPLSPCKHDATAHPEINNGVLTQSDRVASFEKPSTGRCQGKERLPSAAAQAV